MLAEGRDFLSQAPLVEVFPGLVIVLTMSGVALLDKAGWAPLGVAT